jgi:predicted patatin/cPLA2 family phospholipase
MTNIGLILEGGGMRGVYTAGVLDFFIDKGLNFNSIFAVSAGSCQACSYLSKQRGRAFRVNVDYLKDKRYCSVKSLITTGDMFGAKMCYDIIPNQLDLYDYEQFDKYKGNFYVVVTNCNTGKAEYVDIKDMHKDIISVRASSSLPLLSKNVAINEQEYLDGGIADSIPIARSIQEGNKKNVVILTQCEGYRKQPNKISLLFKAKYRRYPHLIEAMKTRYIRYNGALDLIKKEQDIGNAFVIRPQIPPNIGRIEKDKEKLIILYKSGYEDAENCYDKLIDFCEN